MHCVCTSIQFSYHYVFASRMRVYGIMLIIIVRVATLRRP